MVSITFVVEMYFIAKPLQELSNIIVYRVCFMTRAPSPPVFGHHHCTLRVHARNREWLVDGFCVDGSVPDHLGVEHEPESFFARKFGSW